MKNNRIAALIVTGILLFNCFGINVAYAVEMSDIPEKQEGTNVVPEGNVSENGLNSEDRELENGDREEAVQNYLLGTVSEVVSEEVADGVKIVYQAHVQNIGWQSKVESGQMAGTTGRNSNMEALRIWLENDINISGGIEYRAHVQDIGWQPSVHEGELAGTEGKGKAIEAMKIELTGELAEQYDIYYRVHSANYGWLGWAKNGMSAGTKGFAYAAQAIEIKICAKDSLKCPELSGNAYITKSGVGNVFYQAHVQDIGWMSQVSDGATGGVVGENKNLESLRISLSEEVTEYGDLFGSIEYQVYVKNGWTDIVKDGLIAGSVGENTAIQAIKIDLTEQLKDSYDVYYRVHVANYGWLGWAKNGEEAGTEGLSCPAQAIEIKLYSKDIEGKPVQDRNSFLTEKNLGILVYKAHVGTIGWQRAVKDGDLSGTVGCGKHMEALSINLSESANQSGVEGNVVYQAHVEGYGWMDETKDGEVAGTVGQSKQMEAVRIRLEGTVETLYDIYYRVHSSNIGWLDWAKNGEEAGTIGYGLGMEAIEIKLVLKGSDDSFVQTGRSYLSRDLIGSITASGHVEGIGWQKEVSNGGTIGTVGVNKSIEALTINYNTGGKDSVSQYSGGIEYSLHVQDIGWMEWSSDGEITGTVGQGKRAEAVRIRLTGEIANYADVYYRTHVSEYGWLGWACNGKAAGTTKCAYKLQAIEIRIVPKYTTAPGSTSNYYRETPKVVWIMGLRSDLYSSLTPYLILVNRGEHKVGVFQGWQGNWNCIQYWDCANGKASTPTVGGVFQIGSRGYYFDSGGSRCYWWTQFCGDYLFHSVLYNINGTLQDGRVGMALSHGCVRLQIENAKWIYDNIPSGSTVVVYN